MIEQAENILRDLGFYDVRVRHHELGAASTAAQPLALARIELGLSEMPKLLTEDAPARIVAALKKIGYYHVTLDLAGYRRGSTNEVLGRSNGPR
jgi:uncharacterized protein